MAAPVQGLAPQAEELIKPATGGMTTIEAKDLGPQACSLDDPDCIMCSG